MKDQPLHYDNVKRYQASYTIPTPSKTAPLLAPPPLTMKPSIIISGQSKVNSNYYLTIEEEELLDSDRAASQQLLLVTISTPPCPYQLS